MIIYVLDDGETWTLSEPTPVAVTPEQLTRLQGYEGEKVYQVIPDWDKLHPPCNCVKCTADRAASRKIVAAQNEAADKAALIEALDHLATCGGECEECGGLGHTIGFEGPKKIKYPCESCATGTVDQVIAEKREMDARMFLSDLERGE